MNTQNQKIIDKKLIIVISIIGLIAIAMFGSLWYYDGHNIPISTNEEEQQKKDNQVVFAIVSLLIVIALLIILVVVRMLW